MVKLDMSFVLLIALIIVLIIGAVNNVNVDRRLTALETQLDFTAENQLYNEEWNAARHELVDEILSQTAIHATDNNLHLEGAQ